MWQFSEMTILTCMTVSICHTNVINIHGLRLLQSRIHAVSCIKTHKDVSNGKESSNEQAQRAQLYNETLL